MKILYGLLLIFNAGPLYALEFNTIYSNFVKQKDSYFCEKNIEYFSDEFIENNLLTIRNLALLDALHRSGVPKNNISQSMQNIYSSYFRLLNSGEWGSLKDSNDNMRTGCQYYYDSALTMIDAIVTNFLIDPKRPFVPIN